MVFIYFLTMFVGHSILDLQLTVITYKSLLIVFCLKKVSKK